MKQVQAVRPWDASAGQNRRFKTRGSGAWVLRYVPGENGKR